VHIGPDETDTLAHIPRELLFPAPRLPRGHVVLGYDERGHCPMLVDDRCSIYAHRPNACRTYDCRVFAAAGIEMGDDDRPVAQQARRWRFTTPTPDDRNRLWAVRAAARFFEAHPELLPEYAVPRNTTHLAVLAVERHDEFLESDLS
jgi:Fe-S-cluster containining protein